MSKLQTTPMSMSNLPYVKPFDDSGIPRSHTTADIQKIKKSKSSLISENSSIIAEPVSDIPVIDRLQSEIIVNEVKSAIGNEYISDQNKDKLTKITSQANKSATQSNTALARLEGYVDFNEQKVKERLIRSGLIDDKPLSKSLTTFDVDSFVARDQEFIKQRNAKSQERFFNPNKRYTKEELNKFIQPPPEDFLERNKKYNEEKMKYSTDDESMQQSKTPSPGKYSKGYKIRRKRRSIFDVQKGKDLIRSPKEQPKVNEEEEEEVDHEEIERRRQRTYRLAQKAIKRRKQKAEEEERKRKEEEEAKLKTPEKPKHKPKKISSPAYLSFYMSAKEAYKAKYDNKEMMILYKD